MRWMPAAGAAVFLSIGAPGANGGAWAQPAPSVAAPADAPYPGGAITLEVDARDVVRGLFRVTETIPLAAGARTITLRYPEWQPGHHAPRGPIGLIGAMTFSVGGKPVAWRRDPFDVFAFDVDLPAGADRLVASFIHTAPLVPAQGRISMTQEMLNLQWETVSLYPAGYRVARVRIKPSALLPDGWTAAAALEGETAAAGRITWTETDYETLVDSPVFAGRYARAWPLGRSVSIDAVADTPDLLALEPGAVARLSAMIDQATAVFGPPPFDRYRFLVALTDRMGAIGLEHLRSSEIQLEPRVFVDWAEGDWDRNVLPHELVHSWNGKFRRPAGMLTPDYRTPTDNRLLWVYEGQTHFWGYVLAARSGVQTRQTVLDMLARSAAQLASQAGRTWRSVEDTTFDPIVNARRPKPFASLTRGEDYYTEGALIWLEADQIIRQGTRGARGLDDFARAFFAYPGDGVRTASYTRDDVTRALQAVFPYDWAGFFAERIDRAALPSPLAGIELGGYRLAWRDRANGYDQARMRYDGQLNLWHSLGLTLDGEGRVQTANWDGPGFRAGLVDGARIVAVNDVPYSADVLRRAITAAKGGTRPIALLVRRNDHFQTLAIDYHDGLRWPWLERAGGGEAGLDRLLAPRPVERR